MAVGTVYRTVSVAVTRDDLRADLEAALQKWRRGFWANDADILAHYVADVLGRGWWEVSGDREYQAIMAEWRDNGADPGALADYLMAYCEVATGMVEGA